MAREGYRSPPPPDQPYLYEQPDSRYPLSSSYSSSNTHQPLTEYEQHESSRPANMSAMQSDSYNADPAPLQQARQPIDDAVHSAFRGTETTSALSSDIINQITSQITASVMEQLRNSKMPPSADPIPSNATASTFNPVTPATSAASTNNQTSTFVPDTYTGKQAGAYSPSATGSPPIEHRKVYTPPSPYRPSENQYQPPSSPTTNVSQSKAFSTSYGRNTPPPEQRTASPLNQDSHTEDHIVRDEKIERGPRPKGPKRLSTGQNPTILEKIWQTLFDDAGQPTERLNQFLRGIATHLIEDYEPRHSLVITPSKMQKYYEDTKLSSEVYPWEVIFDDRTSSISRLYREIEAQHHLTQDKLDERPDIPGLTPLGFAKWATLLLQANPDQEFQRLQKTALDMPISNPDDKKERFPKEISKRLFPKYPDSKIREKLEKAMATHCNVNLPTRHPSGSDLQPKPDLQPKMDTQVKPAASGRRADSFAQSNSAQPQPVLAQSMRDGGLLGPSSAHPSQPPFTSGIERERQPYSAAVSEAAIEEDFDEDMATPQPIERERKPYVAQPGGGKHYDEANRPASPAEYLPAQATVRPTRSGSIASHGRANDIPKARPIPISVHQNQKTSGVTNDSLPTPDSATASHHRANSMLHRHSSKAQAGRNRSPSAVANGRGYGHTTEDIPYGSYTSSADEDGRNYRTYEKDREKFADDRYDASRMKAYDPREREREREGRQRFKSNAGIDGSGAPYANDDQYFRAPVGGYQAPNDGYPQHSSSYR